MFKDRKTAGQLLTFRLLNFDEDENTIVVGLMRGGIIVAAEIARSLNLPLEMLLVRKLGAPLNPEFAIGAVAEGGVEFLDGDIIHEHHIAEHHVEIELEAQRKELERRIKQYRHGRFPADLRRKTVILVDDGIATGATMHAAIQVVKKAHARYIVVAAPVVSQQAARAIWEEVDLIAFIETMHPHSFAVGEYYKQFPQVTDEAAMQAFLFTDAINPQRPEKLAQSPVP